MNKPRSRGKKKNDIFRVRFNFFFIRTALLNHFSTVTRQILGLLLGFGWNQSPFFISGKLLLSMSTMEADDEPLSEYEERGSSSASIVDMREIDKFLVAQGLKKEPAKKKMLVSSASGDAAFNPPVRKSSRKDSRERQGAARCHWSHPCFNNLHFL